MYLPPHHTSAYSEEEDASRPKSWQPKSSFRHNPYAGRTKVSTFINFEYPPSTSIPPSSHHTFHLFTSMCTGCSEGLCLYAHHPAQLQVFAYSQRSGIQTEQEARRCIYDSTYLPDFEAWLQQAQSNPNNCAAYLDGEWAVVKKEGNFYYKCKTPDCKKLHPRFRADWEKYLRQIHAPLTQFDVLQQ